MDLLSSNIMNLTQRALDATWQKQRIIAENITNAETPGYKAKFASFEVELDRKRTDYSSLTAKDLKEIVESSRTAVYQRNADIKLDGNNVDAETEAVELAKAEFEYQALINYINHQFTQLKAVIQSR